MGRSCQKRLRRSSDILHLRARWDAAVSGSVRGCPRSPGLAKGCLCGPRRVPGRLTRPRGGEGGAGWLVPHPPAQGSPSRRLPATLRKGFQFALHSEVWFLLFLRGRWGRGGSAALRPAVGAVSAWVDSLVVNAGFRGGRLPWQRGARRRPVSRVSERLRYGWSSLLRLPQQPASSYSWSSSSSSLSTSATGVSTSLYPRTVN